MNANNNQNSEEWEIEEIVKPLGGARRKDAVEFLYDIKMMLDAKGCSHIKVCEAELTASGSEVFRFKDIGKDATPLTNQFEILGEKLGKGYVKVRQNGVYIEIVREP